MSQGPLEELYYELTFICDSLGYLSLEKEMAIHSSTIAWKIPWTEEPDRLHSPWGCKESGTTEQFHLLTHLLRLFI